MPLTWWHQLCISAVYKLNACISKSNKYMISNLQNRKSIIFCRAKLRINCKCLEGKYLKRTWKPGKLPQAPTSKLTENQTWRTWRSRISVHSHTHDSRCPSTDKVGLVNGPGRASPTHFYLAHGSNGLGLTGCWLVNGLSRAGLDGKTLAHGPTHGQCPFGL